MRYPKFYEGIAARMCNAVKAGDIETLQQEAAFCATWGSELGLMGRLAEAFVDVMKQSATGENQKKRGYYPQFFQAQGQRPSPSPRRSQYRKQITVPLPR